jgi:hypothetical protein
MSIQMLKLTRKNRRDFGCYSISKDVQEKERKKALNEWRHQMLE